MPKIFMLMHYLFGQIKLNITLTQLRLLCFRQTLFKGKGLSRKKAFTKFPVVKKASAMQLPCIMPNSIAASLNMTLLNNWRLLPVTYATFQMPPNLKMCHGHYLKHGPSLHLILTPVHVAFTPLKHSIKIERKNFNSVSLWPLCGAVHATCWPKATSKQSYDMIRQKGPRTVTNYRQMLRVSSKHVFAACQSVVLAY